MALKIDITDEKGVKVRYHKIKSFKYADGNLKITLASYVNQATRDAEKIASDSNVLAEQYDATTDQIRAELDSYSAQLTPNGEGDPEVIAKIQELSQQVNDRVANPDRPTYTQVADKYYDTYDTELPYFEPLSLENIYAKLSVEGRYAGAESI